MASCCHRTAGLERSASAAVTSPVMAAITADCWTLFPRPRELDVAVHSAYVVNLVTPRYCVSETVGEAHRRHRPDGTVTGVILARMRTQIVVGVAVAGLMLGLTACNGQGSADRAQSGTDQVPAPPSTQVVASTSAVVDTDLREMRERGQSDDAESVEEAFFHGMARAAVILNVEPNTLRVGGGEFRVKRNPVAPGGAFVYNPRDEFYGVTRNLVWWVPSGDVTALMAYPLNGPSKGVTPGLEFPSRAGLLEVPNTADVVGYVFRGETMPAPSATENTSAPVGSFTVLEYRIYQALMDAPMSESQEDALRRIAGEFDTTPEDALRTIDMVQQTLFQNGWMGTPAQQIRRASDWNGESP